MVDALQIAQGDAIIKQIKTYQEWGLDNPGIVVQNNSEILQSAGRVTKSKSGLVVLMECQPSTLFACHTII